MWKLRGLVVLALLVSVLAAPQPVVGRSGKRKGSRRGRSSGGHVPKRLNHPPNPPPITGSSPRVSNESCVVKDRLWEPREKAYLRNSCTSKYKDYPPVGLLLWRPEKSGQMAILQKAFPGAEFIAAWDGPSSGANYKEWRSKLSGPNDFLIYSKRTFTEVEAFERLVKIAAADHVIYLNKDFEITSSSVSWLKSSYEKLKLAKGGAFFSAEGSEPFAAADGAEELYGPYIIARHAIYTKGGVGEHRWCFSQCGIAQGLLFATHSAGLKAYREGSKYAVEDKTGSCISGVTRICDSSPECSQGHGGKEVKMTLIVQFFRRDHMVQQLVTRLKKFDAEILINNDGDTAHNSFMRWADERFHIVHAPNIHEIRGYTRLGQYARGKYLVMLQDDDKPKDVVWLSDMFKVFNSFPGLGMIGGHRGRLDVGRSFDKSTGQVTGEKYGTPSRKGHKFKDITLKDPKTNLKMMFMYKVNAAPLVLKRDVFLELGGFNKNLSCPGDPGIGFDFEYSIRLWYNNYQVGLMYSNFMRSHSKAAGTRANSKIWNMRRRTEIRNNQYFYTMFSGFHAGVGTQKAIAANKKYLK
ncbi:hypothetical protein HOP50_10g60190 [Chloropicon primus]|uniref:Glycosyltransferase 2-like domain-containing protein n=1 Tax=Chloropicon primus TaxID=1764295 RepID=A0A5B8MVK7_9CHLO|nr:hypothetical protein A3770_10p59980 [Chloropicon primus]UPR02692.1 hypothetical protein HOP50_10g60190 [Chloropicon primus]|eukprot:QDZ23480.1 hypothetical protein A3770_10p59980 [Chloropicon primus]